MVWFESVLFGELMKKPDEKSAAEAGFLNIHGEQQGDRDREGEEKLARSVIARGILDALGDDFVIRPSGNTPEEYAASKKRLCSELKEEAREWLDSDSAEVYSFKWWCQVGDLNADKLRGLIEQVDELPAKNRKAFSLL